LEQRRSILRKVLKGFFYTLLVLVLLITGLSVYVVSVSHIDPPAIADTSALSLQRTRVDSTCYTLGNNWFRKSRSGLYELYVEGAPFERGVAYGKLTTELVKKQEDIFTGQFKKLIPSNIYLHFLKYFIGWFNRDLGKNVTEEYKDEIYGVSFSASDDYGYIGTKFERLMNYHAAHDIGHALQSMALVGCTSFATWNGRSADSSLIVGRNFDFYVGDAFAEDKIVAFYHPSAGNRFMMVTWAGFTGVVSGMNEKGLTVTINADKTSIPSGAATPVSLVAREILQYAGNIKEAEAIARKRKMFVSESFLIGSAEDNKAVLIQKTPDSMDLYDAGKDLITCANHFQGDGLGRTKANEEQMAKSASLYRFERLNQLLAAEGPNTPQKTVNILRDRMGINNANIGMGNEKAINQLIAHHSVVFEPKKRLVWVSTSPWQLGSFICYDLNKIFAMHGLPADVEVCDSTQNIAPDPWLQTQQYRDFITYRTLKQEMQDGADIDVKKLIAANPEFYHSYVLAGDHEFKRKNYAPAKAYYQTALTKVVATRQEEDRIRKQISKCDKALTR
jgi:isopenicillin-N N-acyltransferase like protein